jgi:hypothetical protein
VVADPHRTGGPQRRRRELHHPVSNSGNYEDSPILPLFDGDSEPDSVEASQYQLHATVFMEKDDLTLFDPFTTPLPPKAIATDVEAHRVSLEAKRKKEFIERQKFRVGKAILARPPTPQTPAH